MDSNIDVYTFSFLINKIRKISFSLVKNIFYTSLGNSFVKSNSVCNLNFGIHIIANVVINPAEMLDRNFGVIFASIFGSPCFSFGKMKTISKLPPLKGNATAEKSIPQKYI